MYVPLTTNTVVNALYRVPTDNVRGLYTTVHQKYALFVHVGNLVTL